MIYGIVKLVAQYYDGKVVLYEAVERGVVAMPPTIVINYFPPIWEA